MTRKNRADLKEAFKAGALPTESDFHNYIESGINSLDDRLVKQDGDEPLKITSWGGEQKYLDLYADGQGSAAWRIKGNPPKSTADPTAATGLDVSSGDASRLFINQADGKVGLATREPAAHLHVRTNNGEALRLDGPGDSAPDLVVKANGKAGFGIMPADDADARLSVEGELNTDRLQVNADTNLGGNLTVQGNLEVQGTTLHVDHEVHRGNVQLGDEDSDTITLVGEMVSGNSSGKLELRDAVHVQQNLNLDGNLGAGVATPTNKLDVSGAAAIGSAYAGTQTAPADGLLVQGQVGVGKTPEPGTALSVQGLLKSDTSTVVGNAAVGGNLVIAGDLEVQGQTIQVDHEIHHGNVQLGDQDTDRLTINSVISSGHTSGSLEVNDAMHLSEGLWVEGQTGLGVQNPANKLDVSGATVIGETYAGTQTAPPSGLLVEGKVGIGKMPDVTATLAVQGKIQADQVDLSGDVSIGGNLAVLGNTILGDNDADGLAVRGHIRSGNSSGSLEVNDALHVAESVQADGNLEVGGQTVLKGPVTLGDADTDGVVVNGPMTSANSSGSLELRDSVHVTEHLQTDQNLTVAGDTALNGNVALGDGDTDTTTLGGILRSGNSSGNVEINDSVHVVENLKTDGNQQIGGLLNLASGPGVNAVLSQVPWSADNRNEAALVNPKAMMDYIDSLFVGSISAFATDAAPDGWLECDGRLLDRTAYQRLFGRIGVRFGAGDGTSTFQLPDLRGRFVRGWNNTANLDPGRAFGSAQDDAVREHTHPVGEHTHNFTTQPQTVTTDPASNMSNDQTQVGSADDNATVMGASTGPGLSYDPSTADQQAQHTHDIQLSGLNGTTELAGSANTAVQNTGNPGAETRPVNLAMMYCIKF